MCKTAISAENQKLLLSRSRSPSLVVISFSARQSPLLMKFSKLQFYPRRTTLSFIFLKFAVGLIFVIARVVCSRDSLFCNLLRRVKNNIYYLKSNTQREKRKFQFLLKFASLRYTYVAQSLTSFFHLVFSSRRAIALSYSRRIISSIIENVNCAYSDIHSSCLDFNLVFTFKLPK